MRARTILATWLVVASAARADSGKLPVDVPPGWTDHSEAAAPQVAQLRSIPDTVSVTASVFMSPSGGVELAVIMWVTRLGHEPGRADLQQLEHGIVGGSSERATKRISETSHFVGDQLVADQVDDIGPARLHQSRIYAIDGAGLVHILMVTCAGPPDALAPCEAIQRTAHLTIADQVAGTGSSHSSRHDDMSYKIGYAAGVIGSILVAVLLIIRSSRRGRATGR